MDPLTLEQDALYQKICAHLTTLCTRTEYLNRLAKENHWRTDFAQKIVEEYARFLFIAATLGRPVSPPALIDKAWHLHLLYSEDYWERLCPYVLKMDLHHTPQTGDKSDDEKFAIWAQDTLNSYRRFFGMPPAIWTASEWTNYRTVLQAVGLVMCGVGGGILMALLFVPSIWTHVLFAAGGFLIPALILLCAANMSFAKSDCGGISCDSNSAAFGDHAGSGDSGHSCGGGGH